MMRGSKAMAVAVRHPQGHIVVHREPVNHFLYDGWLSRVPLLRGLSLLWDSLGLGMRSLLFSSNVALEEEMRSDEDERPEVTAEPTPTEVTNTFEGPLAWGTILVSLGFSIALFFLLPAYLAGLLENWLGIESALVGNLVEGLVRLMLLIGYVWSVGRIPDIARVFSYHGAEHKTIMAYESGADLDPAVVAGYSKYHPRCGTGFLLTVVVISVLLFSLLGHPTLLVRLASRILFIPVIAGVSYEYLKFTAKYQHLTLVRVLTKPNLWLQRLTTREPDDSMLEVSITALKIVLEAEKSKEVRAETFALVH